MYAMRRISRESADSHRPLTRAERRQRREARRAARRAQHALVTFVLAWGAGELDTWTYDRLERERQALLAQYRNAHMRAHAVMTGAVA